MSEATLPDGYYHEELMWKGVALALSVPIHYVMMQYDGTVVSTCDYFGLMGAGIFTVVPVWLTVTQVLLIILLSLCTLNVWWMYLMFEIDKATDIAYRQASTGLQFALTMSREASSTFEGYTATLDSLCHDTVKEVGTNRVYFGIVAETRDTERLVVAYGPKHKIIFLKKYFKNKEKEEKRKLREEKLNTLKIKEDVEVVLISRSQAVTDEVVPDDIQPEFQTE